MREIKDFLNKPIHLFGDHYISIKVILIISLVLLITTLLMRLIKRIVYRRLTQDSQLKFKSVFSFLNYFVYTLVVLISLQSLGFNLTALFTASAALLVGIGFALQTFFQDIISGIFILSDQSVHVGDIVEIDGKVGRVENIKLRTTRAVTFDNRVLIIPNHKYLTSILYNWTENGIVTREHIDVGVAYGSDVQLVKEVLLKAAKEQKHLLKKPEPVVLFMDFGESSLNFRLVFAINNSFESNLRKSDVRFAIDRLFKENNIEIPFPQRVVHMKNS